VWRNLVLDFRTADGEGALSELSATKVVFLPPNTTSVLQPCDQGIIYAFKQQYRKRLVRHVLHCMEQKCDVIIDVKMAIDFMHAAWNAVSPSAIINCFRKANFDVSPAPAADTESVDVDDIPLALLTDDEWAAVSDGSVTFDQYVSADDVLLTTETQSVQEIAATATCSRDNDDDNDDNGDDDNVSEAASESDQLSTAPATVTRAETITALDAVRAFNETTPDVPDTVFNAIACVHDFLLNTCATVTQRTVTNFFVPRDACNLIAICAA